MREEKGEERKVEKAWTSGSHDLSFHLWLVFDVLCARPVSLASSPSHSLSLHIPTILHLPPSPVIPLPGLPCFRVSGRGCFHKYPLERVRFPPNCPLGTKSTRHHPATTAPPPSSGYLCYRIPCHHLISFAEMLF